MLPAYFCVNRYHAAPAGGLPRSDVSSPGEKRAGEERDAGVSVVGGPDRRRRTAGAGALQLATKRVAVKRPDYAPPRWRRREPNAIVTKGASASIFAGNPSDGVTDCPMALRLSGLRFLNTFICRPDKAYRIRH